MAVSLQVGAVPLSLVGDAAVLGDRADELAALAAEHGFPVWSVEGIIYHGWVKVNEGHVSEGMSLLDSGSAAYRAAGAVMWTPYYAALLAKACELAGQIEEALELLDDAFRTVIRTGERWFAAELYRRKGQLLLRRGEPEAAIELYREALRIAREQEAKLWELRASASLALLRRDQGRRAEAWDLLAPVYDWFTEGFDTPDLVNAKVLLDELGGV